MKETILEEKAAPYENSISKNPLAYHPPVSAKHNGAKLSRNGGRGRIHGVYRGHWPEHHTVPCLRPLLEKALLFSEPTRH